MKKTLLVGISGLLLVSLMLSCTTKNVEEDQRALAEASRNLGEAYLREGKIRYALRELKKAEQLYPDDYILQDDLGLAYFYLENQDRAIFHFKKALALKDDYSPARNNLGNAYAANKEWKKAIEQYKIASEDLVYATPHFPLSNLGLVYYELQDYELAERYFYKALKIKPGFDRALYGLGKTYVAMNRLPDAILKLEKAAEVAPEAPAVHFELANAYALDRQYQKAYNAYQKTAKLAPDTPMAARALREADKIKNLF